MGRILIGALAGITATSAMTIAMNAMRRRLPVHERYPLPPREVTESMLRRTDLGARLDEEPRADLALASHFAFGAATGALYAALTDRPSAGSGTAYALAVWGASYLGAFPSADILRTAADHPRRRNGLMIAAHVVWGTILSLSLREFDDARRHVFSSAPGIRLFPDMPPDRRGDTPAGGSGARPAD